VKDMPWWAVTLAVLALAAFVTYCAVMACAVGT